MKANVFVVIDLKTDKIVYVVAREIDGGYTELGGNQLCNLSEITQQFDSEAAARAYAYRKTGYSHIAMTVRNLGPRYTPLDDLTKNWLKRVLKFNHPRTHRLD